MVDYRPIQGTDVVLVGALNGSSILIKVYIGMVTANMAAVYLVDRGLHGN